MSTPLAKNSGELCSESFRRSLAQALKLTYGRSLCKFSGYPGDKRGALSQTSDAYLTNVIVAFTREGTYDDLVTRKTTHHVVTQMQAFPGFEGR